MANDASVILTVGYDTQSGYSRAERDVRRNAQRLQQITNQYGSGLGVISSDLNQFQKSLHAATSRVLSFGLTVGILFSVKRAFSGLIKETIAVEKSLKDINVILNLNEKSLTSFGNQLFKIAKETGQSFKNIADAGAELARQGLGVTETLKRAKDAAILSRLANQSLEESVESITAGLNSFNESILTSTDLVNKFARVDAAYAVSSRDFAEAVRRVGSTAQDAGVSVEELIGVVTSLQQTTARGGSIIGNSLKTIFTKVQTTGVLEQLERLGITVRGMGDEFLPTLEVLKNLGLEFDKLGKQDQTKAAQLVGNLYQINQVRALAKDLEKAENSVMSKATALARQPGNEAILRNIELNKTLAAELNRTAENIRQVFAEFGKTGIGSGLGILLGGVNTTLEKLIPSNSDEIGSKFGKGFLKGLGDYVIGPGGVGLGLILVSTFVKVLKDVRTGLKTFTFINKLARENAELQTFTASKYSAQKIMVDAINSSSLQRLATENSILGTIQAQNGALSRSTLAGVGIKKGRLGGVPPENAGQFGTGQLFGAMSPAGGGMGFSVNPTSYYSLSGRGAIPSAPVKPLTPITQIANLTRRINQIDRLRQQATDPQILRIAEEERRIASQELGFLRLQNRTANQSFSDTQAQRESIAKGPQAERMNIFSSLHARRREQSVGIQEQVSLNESRQTAFAALDDRDRREAIKQKNDIKRLQRRDDAEVGGSYMFGFKDRRRLETMAKKGVPGASAALSEARLRVSEKLQSRAFGLSFGGPILGNLAAETLASGDTRGGRVAQAGLSGAGNALGYAGMGFALGGPLMGAIGGAAGGITALVNVLKELGTVAPEVASKLADTKQELSLMNDNLAQLSVFTEQIAGIRTGKIKPTDANIEQLSRKFVELTANYDPKTRESFFQESLTGDVNRIETIGKPILGPLQRRHQIAEINEKLQSFAQTGKMGPDVVQGLVSLFGPEYIGSERFRENLKDVSPARHEMTVLGDPYKTPINITGLQRSLSDAHISENQKKQTEAIFSELLRKKPEAAQELLNKLSNLSTQVNPALSRIQGGIRGVAGSGGVVSPYNFARSQTDLVSRLGLGATRFGMQSDLNFARRDRGFNVGVAEDQAALASAETSLFPVPLAQLRGRFTELSIEDRFRLDQDRVKGESRKGFLAQLSQTAGSLQQVGKGGFANVESGLRSLEAKASSGASPEALRAELEKFKQSVSKNFSISTDLSSSLTALERTIEEEVNQQEILRVQRDEQIEINRINTDSAADMAKATTVAKDSLNKFKIGMEYSQVEFDLFFKEGVFAKEAVQEFRNSLKRGTQIFDASFNEGVFGKEATTSFEQGVKRSRQEFEAMRGKGYLFSDQIAQGNLTNDTNDILTGNLKGSAVLKASGKGLLDQFSFETKDVYRSLREGAADVGATMKSSFKDAFKSFIDGSQSAGDALRNLGLAFADKLLDISAQATTDLLFSGLASAGTAAYGSFRNRGKASGGLITGYAGGGMVHGGSGIRDDVPAMLNEGDFVIRKSSVNKYGAGFLGALNLAGGGRARARLAEDSGLLSNFALSDENNPQNALRMEAEAGNLSAYLAYRNAKRAFEQQKRQRRIGALINAGVGIAGAGIQTVYSKPPSGGYSLDSITVGNQPGQTAANYSGPITPVGGYSIRAAGGPIQSFVGGGSVDNIPALLTGGEFVMNRNAVARHGVGFMHKLNRGEVSKYATGGFVGDSTPTSETTSNVSDLTTKLISSIDKLRTTFEKPATQKTSDPTKPQQSGQSIINNVTINLHIDKNGDVKSDGGKNQEQTRNNGVNEEQSRQLANSINNAVLQTLIKESRNGGILESNFQKRR